MVTFVNKNVSELTPCKRNSNHQKNGYKMQGLVCFFKDELTYPEPNRSYEFWKVKSEWESAKRDYLAAEPIENQFLRLTAYAKS
jgi:hypothetical protein